jgi:hypothetical protein
MPLDQKLVISPALRRGNQADGYVIKELLRTCAKQGPWTIFHAASGKRMRPPCPAFSVSPLVFNHLIALKIRPTWLPSPASGDYCKDGDNLSH